MPITSGSFNSIRPKLELFKVAKDGTKILKGVGTDGSHVTATVKLGETEPSFAVISHLPKLHEQNRNGVRTVYASRFTEILKENEEPIFTTNSVNKSYCTITGKHLDTEIISMNNSTGRYCHIEEYTNPAEAEAYNKIKVGNVENFRDYTLFISRDGKWVKSPKKVK